jgi:hypothetical protein
VSLHLHIDRLVLEGTALTPRDAAQLQAILCLELEGLLQARNLHPGLAQGIALPSLPAVPMALPATAGPLAFGRRVARHLAGTLAPEPKP